MRKEKGAIVVEATIALTAFIFAIYMILSLVTMCMVQAKIGVALNTAAKEISQYSYLYYALGADTLDQKISEGTADAKKLVEDTIDGVDKFTTAMGAAGEKTASGNFQDAISDLENAGTTANSLFTKYAKNLKNNPKEFLIGMGKMAGNELKEEAKVIMAQFLAKMFMQKNLMAGPEDNPDQFLRRYGVVNGMDGLDFRYTSFLQNGQSNKIQLVVTYDIRVIDLLNIDYKFKIRQCSKTTAWGRGISVIKPEAPSSSPNPDAAPDAQSTCWDQNPLERGKRIVENEKKNFTYTDSGKGFDAYDPQGGANEFVTITSLDTHKDSYSKAETITSKLQEAYGGMSKKVAVMEKEITVQDQNGQMVTLSSDPDSRSYRVILVVPDDADLELVHKAVGAFESRNRNAKVTIKQGYGSPSEKN